MEHIADMEIPDGYAISIVYDNEFDPRTSVDLPDPEATEYVQAFRRGEMSAYGVLLVNEETEEIVDSLWGVDVAVSNADGGYTQIAAIPDEYLRTIAQELIYNMA